MMRLHSSRRILRSVAETANPSEHGSRLGLWKFKRPEDRMEPDWIYKTLAEMQNNANLLKTLQGEAQQLTRDLKNTLRGK